VRKRVEVAIQRQARFVYFQGTLLGTAAVVVLCVVLGLVSARFWTSHIDTGALVASALFGALGAVVSVFQRISTGTLALDFNASRWQLLSLGGLRPLVGAILGTVAQFAPRRQPVRHQGPAHHSPRRVRSDRLRGRVSERFATDMVVRAGRVLAGTPAEEQPPRAL
jgi:hypothetical protein